MLKLIALPAAAVALLVGAEGATASTPHPTARCDPVPVKTTHGTRYEAYCRLARVKHGEVPCAHANTARVTRCTFTPSSGRWIESVSGDVFAIAGQSIARNGRPGGLYTIASKRGKTGRPPCAKPRSTARAADSAGVSTSVALSSSCVVETLLSSANASGQPLLNYATREVCTSSFPHPDGATLVRRPAPGVYCYRGTGAALNDPNGTERNSSNVYLTGSARCHVIWSGGYEIFAAKRPAVRTYPAPGAVDPNTPVVWRPVTTVPVAN
jgi:hypothetical protein